MIPNTNTNKENRVAARSQAVNWLEMRSIDHPFRVAIRQPISSGWSTVDRVTDENSIRGHLAAAAGRKMALTASGPPLVSLPTHSYTESRNTKVKHGSL